VTNYLKTRFKPGERAVIVTDGDCYYNGAEVRVISGLMPVRGSRGIAAGYYVDPVRRHPDDRGTQLVVYWNDLEPVDDMGCDDPYQVVSWEDGPWQPDDDIVEWIRLMRVVTANAGQLGFKPDVEPGD
jgi:hypothetical protein